MPVSIQWVSETETNDGQEFSTEVTFHELVFDAVLRERHDAEAELTEHNVENSAAISDHKRPRPRAFELTGLVSNTPLEAPPASGFESNTVTTSVQNGVVTFNSEFDRVSDVLSTLERLRTEAVDLTIVTRDLTYENAQLIRISSERTDPLAGREFELSFREVFRSETATTQAPVPREPRGRPPRRGRKGSEDKPLSDDESASADLTAVRSKNASG